jgi:predicted nucleotidyltransferase
LVHDEKSDIDFMMNFQGSKIIDLLSLSKLRRELSLIFDKEIDLLTEGQVYNPEYFGSRFNLNFEKDKELIIA